MVNTKPVGVAYKDPDLDGATLANCTFSGSIFTTIASITGSASDLPITGLAAATGGTVTVTGGASAGSGVAGANANVTGGAATNGNANGGSVVLTGGAKNGSGLDGKIIERSAKLVHQGAATAKTVSATLTAAEITAGIITVNQGGAAPSALQLPLASAMDTGFPSAATNDAFDFSVINISVVDAEDASLTTNTGWTLVGSMDVLAYSAAGTASSGRFRAQKTGTAAWALFRLS